jgi:hypothetical protein
LYCACIRWCGEIYGGRGHFITLPEMGEKEMILYLYLSGQQQKSPELSCKEQRFKVNEGRKESDSKDHKTAMYLIVLREFCKPQ